MKANVSFSWNLKKLVLKELMQDECVSLAFKETSIPHIFFALRIYPYIREETNDNLNVYFGLVIRSKFHVNVESHFYVNSNNFNLHIPYYPFTTSDAELRTCIISSNEFFNHNSGFFDPNGQMKLDIQCTLKSHPDNRIISLFNHFLSLKNKDFVIMVNGKPIKVHKNILEHYSSVFAKMFNNDFKEVKDNIAQINDFAFDTVQYAMDYCYGKNCPNDINILIDLLRFSDKYEMKDLTNEVEDKLDDLLDASVVVLVLNETKLFASENLISSCMKTLIYCIQNQIEILNKETLSDQIRLQFVKYLFHS